MEREKHDGGSGESGDSDFEASFERLEEVVDSLESGDLTLDEAVELYEEGVELADDCRGRLNEVEHRLEVLEDDSRDVDKGGDTR